MVKKKDNFDDLKYWQNKTLEFQNYFRKTDKKINKKALEKFETEMRKFFKKQKCQK